MAFDDLDDSALRNARDRIAEAALTTARLIAAERLSSAIGAGAPDPETVVSVLLARDPADDRYDLLRGFEQRWALMVIKLLEPVTNPAAAIRDARLRGVTISSIADLLGIASQTVYQRYGDQIIVNR